MKANTLKILVLLLLPLTIFSQDLELSPKDSIIESSWIFGIGFNAVDDAGSEFSNLFDIEDNWNIVPFPSRVSIGRYFKSGLGIEAIGSYNQYQEGKTIDNVVIAEDIDYYAIDLRVSYDLNKILGETGWFDPYVGIGAGYTDANNEGRGTYNATVGFRTWFSDRFGLDFNSTGKWAMSTENATNHIQHAASVLYRFNIKKGLSRAGEDKLALLEEMQKEEDRVNDSIAAAKVAEEEARRLAERLEKEKEATRLAAEEAAKKESAQNEMNQLKAQIENLGNVLFALNSSYLTESDKRILDELVTILENNPALKIAINGHTDSRGNEKYNQWLSERRAERTASYLISKGIAQERITPNGFGESRLTNECDDVTPCSNEKHAQNRRSEFTIQPQ